MKWIISVLVVLMVIPIVSASHISITPESFKLDIVSSENRSINITAVWNGETSIVAYLHHNTIEGLNLIVGVKFILETNKPIIIPVKFVAQPNLAPDNYSVKIWLEASIQEKTNIETVYVYRGGGYEEIEIEVEKWYENDTRLNETLKIIEELKEDIVNISSLYGEIDILKDNISEIITSYEDKLNEKDGDIQIIQIVFVLLVVLLIIILLVIKREYIRKVCGLKEME